MAKIVDRKVTLTNEGDEVFEGKWDGVEYVIEPGNYIELEHGIAAHFCDPVRYPDNELKIEEIIPDPVSSRAPADPLAESTRGKGFEKITGKPKQEKPPAAE